MQSLLLLFPAEGFIYTVSWFLSFVSFLQENNTSETHQGCFNSSSFQSFLDYSLMSRIKGQDELVSRTFWQHKTEEIVH